LTGNCPVSDRYFAHCLSYGYLGNHCIAIIKEPEKYDSLLLSLADIRNAVESLPNIEINGICFDIEYYLGED